MSGIIALGILAVIILGCVILIGIWLAILGLGALFGTWFVSGNTLENNRNFRKDDMADIFAGNWDRQEKKETKK